MFFEGFTLTNWEGPEGMIRFRQGGSGPPLLLVHGNPQTHVMWHKVAPTLAKRFHVICPDLRGYGGSHKPPATPDHLPYAKRAMAAELVALMQHLGHDQFQVAGHDRGARVAHRLALDHPERVSRLAVLDIIPTLAHFERTDIEFAKGYYHWFWFAQPHPFPENVISAAPDAWFRAHTSREPKPPDFFAPDALADYMTYVRTPDMIRGMCEDYRAAITIDLTHDRASRSNQQRVQCPLLVLWGTKAKIEAWYDALAIWKSYSDGPVSGRGLTSGHYVPEEAPDEVITEFTAFFEGKTTC